MSKAEHTSESIRAVTQSIISSREEQRERNLQARELIGRAKAFNDMFDWIAKNQGSSIGNMRAYAKAECEKAIEAAKETQR